MEAASNQFTHKKDINVMIMELFQQGLSAQDVHDKLQQDYRVNIVVSYLESVQNQLQN